jgi:hypothetical protein
MRPVFPAAALVLIMGMTPTLAVQLKEQGERSDSGVCGGFAGYVCSDKEWCDFPPEASCGIGDQLGKCRPRPEVCTMVYLPVCGCNDKTYSNACQAAADGADVASPGRCQGDDRPE